MPAKTGGSHALAAFVTYVVGSTLSKYVWELVPPLGVISSMLVEGLQLIPGVSLPVTDHFAGTLVLMVALSFVWGLVYHLGRHG